MTGSLTLLATLGVSLAAPAGAAPAGAERTGAAPAGAVPTTLYVAQGGSDASNNCASAATPCATVSQALTQGSAGDTIEVSGTIADRFTIIYAVTITGADAPAGSPAVIDGSGADTVVHVKANGVTLDHLVIQNGTAANGGGIFVQGDLTISNSTITANKADAGAGIYDYDNTVTVDNSTISGNTAGACGCNGGSGGAGIMVLNFGVLYLNNSTVSGNSAPGNGGGIYAENTAGLAISGSTVSGNSSGQWGGGIYNGNLEADHDTITGNTALDGGGLYVPGGIVRLVQTTVAGNSDQPGGSGSGIFSDEATVRMSASILGPNPNGNCSGLINAGTVWSSLGYNLDSGTSCHLDQPTDLTGTDPELGTLQNNGGATLTELPAATGPAVNQIPSGTTLDGFADCPRTDQAGVTGPVGPFTMCTIGALEGIPANVIQAPLFVTSLAGTFAAPLTLTTSGGSGSGSVTFTVSDGTATGCAISASAPYTLSTGTVGTCLVVATKAGDALYPPVSSPEATVTVTAGVQSALAVTSTSGTFLAPMTLTTSGGSGTGAVTFAAANGTATGCAISASAPYTLSSSGAGTCTVTATKAADADYQAISSAPTTVTIAPAAQAPLMVTSTSGTYFTPLPLTTSGGSGTGAVTYTAANGTATGCAVSASAPYTLSSSSAGTCTVTATEAADSNYLATSSAATTVTLAKAAQAALTITSTSGTYLTPLSLTTSGGSGSGNVTYAAANGTATGCKVSTTAPYKLSSSSAGTCTVTATKAADVDYLAISSAASTVTLAVAPQSTLKVTSISGTYLTPLTLATSGGSGTGAVTYTATNGTATGCAVSTTTPYRLSTASAGTCTVTATKAADANFLATTSAATTVTIAKAPQAPLKITSTLGTPPLTLTTSGGSGSGAVTYMATNGTATGCAVSATAPYTLSATSAGTCKVTASKATDVDYLATSSPVTALTIGVSVAINQASGQADPATGTPILFTAVFNKAVTGFAGSQVAFAGSTAPGTLLATVTGSGTTYTVAVNGMTGPGVVKVSIPTNVVPGGNFAASSTDNTVTYAAPTVTINQASSQADPTTATSINYTVVFSKAVTGFTGSGLSFAGSTVPGTLGATVTGSGTTYNVAVSGMTGPGVVKASVKASVVSGGNALSTSTDNSVTYTAAGVTVNQAPTQADPTAGATIAFTATFSRAVTGFGTSGVSFAGSTAPGKLAATITGSGTTYTIDVSGMSGYGTVKLSTLANVVTGGNAPSTSTDNVVTYVPATVTVNQASGQADPTSATPIRFTVTFSKAVSGFTAAKVSLAGSTAPGTLVAKVSGSGTTYTVSVSGMTGAGKVTASVPANVVAGGNAPSTSTDNVVTFT